MAKSKMTMTVSLEEFGKKAGEYALDELEYKGLTIRQWANKITSGEYQPVKHGRWMHPFYCSECGFTPYYSSDLTYNYCPNCGSCMKDGDDNEKP